MVPPCRLRCGSWLMAVPLWVAAACSGVSVPPADYAAEPPPARQLDPEQARAVQALQARAVAAVEEERFAAAEEAARSALAVDPAAARARAVLGLCLLHRAQQSEPADIGLLARGEGESLLAVKLQPADPVAARLHALFLARTGHLSAAAAAAEAGLQEQHGEPDGEVLELLAAAADYRYELGEERGARPHLQRLVEHRDDAGAFYRLGICNLRIAESVADLDAAAAAFAAACERDPNDPQACLAVGQAWLAAAGLAADSGDRAAADERLERARKAFEDAVARFPAAVEPRFGRALALERAGRVEEAWQAYQDLLEVHPGHVGALLNLGALLASRAETDPALQAQAEALLRQALQSAPEGGLTAGERRRIRDWLDGIRRP